jgi:hypothetical protein
MDDKHIVLDSFSKTRRMVEGIQSQPQSWLEIIHPLEVTKSSTNKEEE